MIYRMVRRGFLGALAGALGLKAQVKNTDPGDPKCPPFRLDGGKDGQVVRMNEKGCAEWVDAPPASGDLPLQLRRGECPVCGTVAPPWNQEWIEVNDGCISNPLVDNKDPSTWWCRMKSHREYVGETSKIVRCHRCNAAFWQDAELEGAAHE